MDEFNLIKKYVRSPQDQKVVLGAGDDCSVIEWSESQFLITTSDALVENKHFRLQDISFKELGYKSLAVNLSDISAMGGQARWAQLTLAIPSSVVESDIADFFTGFYELADTENISLVGGDMSSSEDSLFINITLSGVVDRNQIKYRSNIGKGDCLCVTGDLGSSAAGLKSLLENRGHQYFESTHKRPPIFHRQGQWLASQESVVGMMDLSDGLMSDLKRFSGAFQIDVDQVPLSSEFKTVPSDWGWDPFGLALGGGEDYVLLLSCKESSLEILQKNYKDEFGHELFCIGRKISGEESSFVRDGQVFNCDYKPFSHF